MSESQQYPSSEWVELEDWERIYTQVYSTILVAMVFFSFSVAIWWRNAFPVNKFSLPLFFMSVFNLVFVLFLGMIGSSNCIPFFVSFLTGAYGTFAIVLFAIRVYVNLLFERKQYILSSESDSDNEEVLSPKMTRSLDAFTNLLLRQRAQLNNGLFQTQVVAVFGTALAIVFIVTQANTNGFTELNVESEGDFSPICAALCRPVIFTYIGVSFLCILIPMSCYLIFGFVRYLAGSQDGTGSYQLIKVSLAAFILILFIAAVPVLTGIQDAILDSLDAIVMIALIVFALINPTLIAYRQRKLVDNAELREEIDLLHVDSQQSVRATRDTSVERLEQILSNRKTRNDFRQHLAKEWASENLTFIEAVEKLKKSSESQVKELCSDIFNLYIHDNAETPVNLPSVELTRLKRRMKVDSEIHKGMFDGALHHIKTVLANDNMRRFLAKK